jgi:hypothetical protein
MSDWSSKEKLRHHGHSNFLVQEKYDIPSDSEEEEMHMMNRHKGSENYKSASASSNTWRHNPTSYNNQQPRQLFLDNYSLAPPCIIPKRDYNIAMKTSQIRINTGSVMERRVMKGIVTTI